MSPNEPAKNLRVIFSSDMSINKHITSVVKPISFNFMNFDIFKLSSLNLLLLHLQMPLKKSCRGHIQIYNIMWGPTNCTSSITT